MPEVDFLGIGDDCALFSDINNQNNYSWAISKDLLLEGRHFFGDTDPYNLGHKALAVNLSDLAAMGATPCFFLLGVGLPKADKIWLEKFTRGVLDTAKQHKCLLIGGDTTKSNHDISISITIIGKVNTKSTLKRSNAKIGDDIWVTGTLGDARLALGNLLGEWILPDSIFNIVNQKLEYPIPRLELGQSLVGIANSAIDISDGLIGDLRHVLNQSNVHAEIYIDNLPRSESLLQQEAHIQNICTLSGGDDYELCFTAPNTAFYDILELSNKFNTPITCIGKVLPRVDTSGNIIKFMEYGQNVELDERIFKGFEHFSIV
jgi:thiamine-monophosphate kinase